MGSLSSTCTRLFQCLEELTGKPISHICPSPGRHFLSFSYLAQESQRHPQLALGTAQTGKPQLNPLSAAGAGRRAGIPASKGTR